VVAHRKDDPYFPIKIITLAWARGRDGATENPSRAAATVTDPATRPRRPSVRFLGACICDPS
jgi:hypothetical protein